MSIPTPEELFTSFRQAYKDTAIDPEMDRIFDDDYDWAVALCDRAGVAAVRDAVLDALIAEADDLEFYDTHTNMIGGPMADWLRSLKGDQP